MDTVTDRAYLERREAAGCEFVDITLREADRVFWVEEVVGTVDELGKRRGVIETLSERGPRAAAFAVFQAQVSRRSGDGYAMARI